MLPTEFGIPDGYMIIEGDIIVPDDFYETRGTFATNLWPNGEVPYEFHPLVTPSQQQAMLAAMSDWEQVANVDFRVRTSEPDFVMIVAWTSNSSYVGLQGGQQEIYISSWNYEYTIAHELAHTLGFWHEQSRADRDGFVTINTGNIQAGYEHNFDVRGDQGPLGSGEYGPYDFDSVMHYSACAFSVCCPAGSGCACPAGCYTITVQPQYTQWQNLIGQSDHLSDLDKLTMSFLYPEPNWRFVALANQNPPDSGAFLQPWTSAITGLQSTPAGGTLFIQPGTYSAVGTYATPIRIVAPLGYVGGYVTLGD